MISVMSGCTELPISCTSSWLTSTIFSGTPRSVTIEIPKQRMPAWLATITSGTVLMPTASPQWCGNSDIRQGFQRLVCRANIHTFYHFYIVFSSYCFCFSNQFFRICFAHVGEARCPIQANFVHATDAQEKIDVIGNNHQISNLKVGVHAA